MTFELQENTIKQANVECYQTGSKQLEDCILYVHSILRWMLALALNADKNATKSLKFKPSTIFSTLWGIPKEKDKLSFTNFSTRTSQTQAQNLTISRN